MEGSKKKEKMGGIMGLVMIHGILNAFQWCNSWDTWVCMNKFVWSVGVWNWQKKAKIKAQWQNIWLPGNRASSKRSIKLWRMVVHDSTSQIWFQNGVGAGRRGVGQRQRNVYTCPDLSEPLNSDTSHYRCRLPGPDPGISSGALRLGEGLEVSC